MAKTPEEGMASLFRNLREQTGRSIDEWVVTARAWGLTKHKELVARIKADHGLSHGYAHQIALKTLAAVDAPASGSDQVVEAQYAGARAGARPIHDALIARARGFGPDVECSPKKAYVSLRRTKQFAMIQPSTASRVDLGLILKGVAPSGRLEASGSFNAMFTHRVKLEALEDVDDEVTGWLRQAYDGA